MEQRKEEGTAFFKQGKWTEALASYQAALAFPDAPLEMQSVLLSNIAACQLKLKDFAGAVESCNRAIDMPKLPQGLMEKLLFRRAQGNMEIDQLTAAARDVKAVLQLNQGNKAAVQLLHTLQEKARADASGVGKALKSLKEAPTLDALRFLEHAPDSSVYRDVLAQQGEAVLWKCVYRYEDRAIGAGALRVLHKIATTISAAPILAAIDIPILTTFVQLPNTTPEMKKDDFALETAVTGLCGALSAYLLTQPESSQQALRALVDAVLNGLRSPEIPLQVAALDSLLSDIKDFAKLKTLLDELGIFPLLRSRADIFEEKTVSRIALVFSQVLAAFESQDSLVERIVQDNCILPIMAASTMAAASPGAILLCSVFLVNAKLGSLAIQRQTQFFPHLSSLLLAHTTKLAYQELVMDLVAFVAGSETGVACIPLELRVELGKIMQCDMDAVHLKLQATAVAALVKMSIVEKSFEADTPTGRAMIDIVLELMGRLDESHSRPSLVGSTAQERAVEALSYLITYTTVKDELVKQSGALNPLFSISATMPSNLLYGISYILHHLLTSESELKKQKMATSELTPDQYEQLQKALKQKSELDDGDSPAQVQARLSAVLAHPTSIKTLVQLLKTKSPAILDMAIQSALHATECVPVRGKLVQGGLLAALFPRAVSSEAAQQAIAKILITTNPNLIPSAQLLSAVQPLRTLCQNKNDAALLHFEALMALTNIASVSMETKARVLADQGLNAIQYLQFSDHALVRRAATECLTNLLPHDDVIEKVFCQPDKLRLWLAFASIEEAEEDFETARAASGALAMVSQYPEVCKVLLEQNPLTTFQAVLAESTSPELIHRHAFAVQNCLEYVASLKDNAEEGNMKATYEAQFLLLKPTVAALVKRTKEAEIRPIAQACLDMIDKFDA
ncbi:hypothetical protein LEN26_006245 [Aphanomyces euteiches]|nr:hypothetical protein LEN26_006245 [Aphanomyces euteiches]